METPPINNDKGHRCRVKKEYMNAGQEGDLITLVAPQDRVWAVVVWDGEDEPDLFKMEGLEVKLEDKWISLVTNYEKDTPNAVWVER